jgi:hypothetical protein
MPYKTRPWGNHFKNFVLYLKNKETCIYAETKNKKSKKLSNIAMARGNL